MAPADPETPSGDGRPTPASGAGWLQRWMESVADLRRLRDSHPMLDAVIDEVRGRDIRIGDRWLADFASCNYLGLDLDPDIIESVPRYLRSWGTHPSWSRLLGSPVLYERLEDRLTELLGCEDTLLLPTITHIHTAVIPLLVGEGVVFLDSRAHKTIYDGCEIARGHGANVTRFHHADPDHLEGLLRSTTATPRVIAMDGVNSMTGNAPDIRRFAALAREHDALLYVDDAHGFGVIGERRPGEPCDYGVRGNGVVRHQGETYEGIVFVAGLSKAYSSMLAFLAVPTALKRALKVAAPPYLFSGPSPVASLATAWEGLRVNDERGDSLRAAIHRKTNRVLARLRELGIHTPNRSGHPIVEVPLARPEEIDRMGRLLFDRGIYVTLAAYPLVPRNEVGFRVQITAANPDEHIELLCQVLGELADRFELRRDHAPEAQPSRPARSRLASSPHR